MLGNYQSKEYYDALGGTYLTCWTSIAKDILSKKELDFVRQNMKTVCSGRTSIDLLEIGFGPGRIAGELLGNDINYYGIDISSKMKDCFIKNIPHSEKIKLLLTDDIGDPHFLPDIKFDCIVAMRVLYYDKNWKKNITRIAEMIKPNGYFIFTMLNQNSSAILGKLFEKGLTGHYCTYDELSDLIIGNNFSIVDYRGFARLPDVVYDFCNSTMSSRLLAYAEKALEVILGQKLLIRMYYFCLRKNQGALR